MIILPTRVYCYRCRKTVEKSETRYVGMLGREERFECFNCFKKDRTVPWKAEETGERLELYCERCRYKFYSKKLFCPYCNQGDMIMKGNISVNDLL